MDESHLILCNLCMVNMMSTAKAALYARVAYSLGVMYSCLCSSTSTVKAIILTRRIYNDFPKLTSLRVPKVALLTHSQRSIGQYCKTCIYNEEVNLTF